MDELGPIGHHDGVLEAVKLCSALLWDGTAARVLPLVCRAEPVALSGAVAVCHQGCGGPVPAAGCACGFWGCGTMRQVRAAVGRPVRFYDVVLHVALSGRVVEHEHGWRAARQDVVGVGFQRRCARCGSRRQVRLEADGVGRVRPACGRCGAGESVELEQLVLGTPGVAAWWVGSSSTWW